MLRIAPQGDGVPCVVPTIAACVMLRSTRSVRLEA